MPTFLAEILSQLKAIWARLDSGQRFVTLAVLAAAMVGVGALVWFAGRPELRTLMTNEDGRSLAKAIAALEQNSIAYVRRGNEILVESSDVGTATSVLRTTGVVGGSVGSDIESSLGSITMDSRSKEYVLAQKNRRLAEEAVRTISGVAAVNIGFSKPKRLPYSSTDDETRPRATVTVTLTSHSAPFRRIAASAVEAAAAPLGMPPEYVTVINAATAEIFRLMADGRDEIGTSDFLQEQARRSEELTAQAQTMLSSMYPAQAQVLVTVDLDPNWSITKQKILPETPLLRSDESTTSETPTGSGTRGGDPSAAAAVLGGGGGEVQVPFATEAIRKREYYDTVLGESHSGKRASDIRRLSIALVVDEVHRAKEQSIVALVKRAVGWNDVRDGDGFAIHFETLQAPPELPAVAGPSMLETMTPWLPTLAQVVSVILVLMFLRGLLRRSAKPTPVVKTRAAQVAEALKKKEPDTPEELLKLMRREIENSISEDPAAITRLLETWLSEQKV